MNDPQQRLVYKWEQQLRRHPHFDDMDLPRVVIRAAVDHISAAWGCKAPNLRFNAKLQRRAYFEPHDRLGTGPKNARTYNDYGCIVMPGNVNSWATNIMVIIHEMIHAVHYQLGWDRDQPHGPEFMGMFIWQLTRDTEFIQPELETTCDILGIKYNYTKCVHHEDYKK